MTQEQKDEIDATIAYVRGVNDVLELHERRLRDFGDVRVDPSDPYSIEAKDAADALSYARAYLGDVMEMLRAFDNAKIEEAK
mgnify:CR=1 FL=1